MSEPVTKPEPVTKQELIEARAEIERLRGLVEVLRAMYKEEAGQDGSEEGQERGG